MVLLRLFALLYFACLCQCLPFRRNMPVIGILCQESYPEDLKHGDTYIDGEYVKWVQSGGAKVVPIRVNETESYYEDLMNKINGVLLPGGMVDVVNSGYGKAAEIIYRTAIKLNNAGSYFPLWGTCLGFEAFTVLQAGKNLLVKCSAEDYMLPLKFTQSWLASRLFTMADRTIPLDLIQQNMTANYHEFCMTSKTFNATKELSGFFRMISTNRDRNGLEFVSMIEAFDYPIYASQWHPEKNSYDMGYQDQVPHTYKSVRASQYFANFFVDEARKSKHQYAAIDEESNALIENFIPVYLGKIEFREFYFFNITRTAEKSESPQPLRMWFEDFNSRLDKL